MNHAIRDKIKYIIIAVFAVIVVNAGSLSNASASILASNLVELTNTSRAQNKLAPLNTNDQLTSAAYAKANDMFTNGYFAHTSPSGKTPWRFIKDAGYDYAYAGENLAIGYTENTELQNAWLNSPSHRDNILNPNYRDIGMAAVSGTYQGAQTTIVVEEFGSSTFAQPVAAVASANQNSGFSIDSTKTSFKPAKIYNGEQVDFTAGVTGNVSKSYFQIGNQQIDLGSDFTAKAKITQTGNFPVNLIVVDKAGEAHTQTIGNIEVIPTTISKNDMVNNTNSTNLYAIIISVILLAGLVFAYIILKKKKLQIPVFKLS